MLTRLRHVRRDERGISFVYVAVGFMAFLSATTLAIDVGMFMAARAQAQNSADSGALAGAVALVFNSWTDRTPSGPAVQSALHAAQANQVMAKSVSVTPPDVTFPNDPNGQPNRVKVNVYRTADRSNAIPTLMGSLFGVSNVSIGATATAEASQANAETCVKPFTIPDRWQENQDPGGWTPNSTFDIYDNKGNPIKNPDVYRGPNDPNPTSYNPTRDKGLEITLKADNNTKITASFYDPWDLPGSVGADDYRSNIANCNSNIFQPGQNMPPETGNMVGPTAQGMQDLIDQDPNAYWDTGCNCEKGSQNAKNPRVVVIPLYDPVAYANGKQHGKVIDLTMVNYLGFFIEPMVGGQVKGRITPVLGITKGNGPAPPGMFPRVIRLVQ